MTVSLLNSILGAIWVRYAFVITPVNYTLATVCCSYSLSLFDLLTSCEQVNLFVGGTGLYQLSRIYKCVPCREMVFLYLLCFAAGGNSIRPRQPPHNAAYIPCSRLAQHITLFVDLHAIGSRIRHYMLGIQLQSCLERSS